MAQGTTDVADTALGAETGARAGGAEALEAAYGDALAPLRIKGEDLFEQAMGFVRDGTTAEVVDTLRKGRTGDVDQLMNKPAAQIPDFKVRGTLVEQVAALHPGWEAEAGVAARGTIYATAPAAVVVRLGHLLDAVTTGKVQPEEAPRWLSLLMYDAGSSQDADERWPHEFLVSLAREGGVPDDEAAPLVLRIMLENAHLWIEALCVALVTHADVLPRVLDSLSDWGTQAFLRCAERDLPRHSELVATLAADPRERVRSAARDLLSDLDGADEVRLLAPHLVTAPLDRVGGLLARVSLLPGGLAAIREAIDGAGGQAARTRLLRQTLERAEALLADQVAVTVPPFEPEPDVVLGDELVVAARALLDGQAAKAAEQLRAAASDQAAHRADDELTYLRGITDAELRAAVRLMNDHAFRVGVWADGKDGRPAQATASWLMRQAVRLPGTPLVARVRLLLAYHGYPDQATWWLDSVAPDLGDLRALESAFVRCGVADTERLIDDLVFQQNQESGWPASSDIWPYFAEHPDLLVARLTPADDEIRWDFAFDRALGILREFPVAPTAVLPRLGELALGGGKVHRAAAREILGSHPGARRLAEQGLGEKKAEIRASAAAWLARIADPAAVPALRALLEKEGKEAVRAALLSALEALGDDISADVAPEVLLAEAAKGLTRQVPRELERWFPFGQLPEARWADGAVVPAELLRWWVVLACTLKDPSGEGLFARYVSMLDPASRKALGSFVLSAWIAQDTIHPPVAESRALAESEAPRRYESHQRMAQLYPRDYASLAERSVEEHYNALFREHQGQYLDSAVKEKGLLALTVGMPGPDLAAAAQHYFRENKGRRAQAEALVRALAANGDQAAVQLLLAVSRRFRQRSVQEIAAGLAQDLAVRRGWDADQLADRTVPTAGFDDDGVLRLDLGSPSGARAASTTRADDVGASPEEDRMFTGRLTEKFTLELRTPEGKVVKALPPKRASDDDDAYADAKKQLSASRKELKTVLALQTQRFVEAMCSGRTWAVDEWREYVLGHPLMSRLAVRLVWVATPPDGGSAGLGDSAPGTVAGPGTVTGPDTVAFRPGDGGTLIGVDDGDIVLPEGARVSIAHAVTLPDQGRDVEAWCGHLADYAITPLFDQGLGPDAVGLPELAPGATEVADHRGWLSDSFAIRGRATKRGFARTESRDNGWFDSYVKEYPSLGVVAEIGFTGSIVPEENIPAAVTELTFRRAGRPGRVRLADLPAVLVAASYQDYVTVARAGQFDPDWREKSQY
ncbi:DUF4132 domain-containing protein [Promicromonospora sp. NPDC057138]|uniref:DUF4132 domain-containing protein n=1 Tax=Promicromonospora sp. NPDC057138 TaxID=3346031 RepID=UPI003638F8C7